MELHNVATQYVEKSAIDISDASFTWRKVGNVFEALAQLLILAQIPLSFVAGRGYPLLSDVSGSLGVVALAVLKFSSYAMSESKERTSQFNEILKARGVTEVPDITPH